MWICDKTGGKGGYVTRQVSALKIIARLTILYHTVRVSTAKEYNGQFLLLTVKMYVYKKTFETTSNVVSAFLGNNIAQHPGSTLLAQTRPN